MKPIFAFFCLFSGAMCTAQETDFSHLNDVYRRLPVRYFDTTTDAKFSAPQLAMKMLLIYESKNQRTNHFCVIGYEWGDGDRQAPVFWKEGEKIIWWDGGSSESRDDLNSIAVYAKRNILGKDTVDTADEIGTSTYLMLRSGVEAIIQDCTKNGNWYVIEPFKVPPPCKDYECDMPGVDPLSQQIE
jgi:hypothetical protein